MDQKTQRSRAFPPTLCHGVARIFLTAPLSYDAVALHRGQCEQLLRCGKLATSSIRFFGLLSISSLLLDTVKTRPSVTSISVHLHFWHTSAKRGLSTSQLLQPS